jgi:hypothetical protein
LQTTVTAAYKNTKVANTIATDVSAGGIPGKKLQKTSTSKMLQMEAPKVLLITFYCY